MLTRSGEFGLRKQAPLAGEVLAAFVGDPAP